jgi:hypothetical protein
MRLAAMSMRVPVESVSWIDMLPVGGLPFQGLELSPDLRDLPL